MEEEGEIFTLETENTNGGAIGDAAKVTKRVVAKPLKNNFQIVDVFNHKIFANEINDTLKKKLPFVYIEEYSLISNSLINQFRYFGSITNLQQVIQGQADAVSQVAGEVQSNTIGGTQIKSIFETIAGVTGYISNATGATDLARSIDPAKILPKISSQNLKQSTFSSQLVGESLKPYNGLYQTIPTNFRYIMPYFEDKYQDINNKFVDNFTGFMGVETQPLKFAPNIFRAGADMVKNVGEAFLSLPTGKGGAYNSPSTYVEIPQYFSAGEYDSYTVKFDLLNTFSVKDVQKNYDLIFLLAFQNLPFREDIARIVPPKLYTLLIPGQTFLPYCHMKSIKIDYIGNRRQHELYKFNYHNLTGTKLPKDLQSVIVPDCYRVTIEFLSMVKPASNFMLVPDIRVTESTGLITAAEVVNDTQPTFTPPETPTTRFNPTTLQPEVSNETINRPLTL